MELVMMTVNKEETLREVDEIGQKNEEISDVVFYSPEPQAKEVVDEIVSKKLSEIRKTETEKTESKNLEERKFKEALVFTDIEKTIKKMGLNSGNTPRGAIARIFTKTVLFGKKECLQGFYSDGFSFQLGEKAESENFLVRFKKEPPLFMMLLFAMLSIFGIGSFLGHDIRNLFYLISISYSLIVFITSTCCLSAYYDNYFFTSFFNDNGKAIKVKTGITVQVPQIPEKILKEIKGPGPFVILFEVSKGWERVETDPVILRVITLDGGRRFFEPVVGYNITLLEKKSLTELVEPV